MAVTASDLTDYTFAQIRTAAKHGMMNSIMGGATLTINGRSIGRCTLKELRDLYDWADEMANLESGDTGGNIALTKFDDAI